MRHLGYYGHSIRSFLRSRESRACYLATAIFGTLSYLYLFVNNISNNDMIACLPKGYGTGVTSGRWLLHLLGTVVDRIWGTYNVPIFNGLLALLLLALTSALLVRVLEVRRRSVCFAVAAVNAAASPIASTMFFQFTVHYFVLALLCVVAAAYLLKRPSIVAFLGAAVLGACSLGIYQAYFPFFAVLLLLTVLISSLDAEKSTKAVIFHGLRCLAALILSYLLYRLLLQVCLTVLGAQLSNYQGMSSMGSLSLRRIPQAYAEFFLLPVREFAGFNSTAFLRLMLLLLMAASALLLLLFLRGKATRVLLSLLIVLLLPLAANAFLFLAAQSTIYTRMCMGLMAVYYLPVVLAEHLPIRKGKAKRAAALALAAVLLLTSVNYAWQSNGNYQMVFYSNRKAENYFTTLFTRIKSLEGYREEMPVVFVGEKFSDLSYQDNWLNTPFLYRGRTGAVAQLNQYSRGQFVANYLGYSFRSITEAEATRYADEIDAMACYPDDGSLQIVDGMVLVRLE